MNCDPDSLMQAAKCYRCIPSGMLGAVQVDLLCRWANTPVTPAGCTDPIEQDWFNRIQLGGAPEPSQAQRTAVCEFCHALRVAAIEDMFHFINVILPRTPGDITTMAYPLIGSVLDGILSPWNNFLFVDGDLNNDGLAGSHVVGKYMETGQPVFQDPYDCGLTCQQSELRTEGEIDSTTLGFWNQLDVDCRFTLSTFEANVGAGPKGYLVDPTNSAATVQGEEVAFYSCSRSAVDLLELWWGRTGPGLLLLDTDVTDVSAIILELTATYFMAMHFTDVVTEEARWHTSKRMSFAAAHRAFDQFQTNALFEAVQDLRIAFGGGDV